MGLMNDIVKFGQNCEFFGDIVKCGQYCEIWSILLNLGEPGETSTASGN